MMDDLVDSLYLIFLIIISEKLKHTIKDLDTNMSYFNFNKLRNIIKGHKDAPLISNNKNVV